MEECEGLDSEMTELRELQCEASEVISQDDEDEVEELHNSLREVVQDQSVKPKLQCLMVDPSFSMVTVQSEDSGIVWETASSRCSTPWASETSSISEASSMDGSGAAGKITIVFDEEKIVRRRTRSGGRSSRLGDRLSRPGSSRSASALGVERLEMAEVSLPNVKQEKTKTEPDLEELKNKDQQLFSLISEGYEILNIRVPSKLPTVDEEETTELQDNLSYLDQTPKIRSRKHHDPTQQQNHVQPEIQEPSEQESPLPSPDTELRQTPTQKESSGDIDYFEKFTLVDAVSPGDQAPEVQERVEQPAVKTHVEEKKPVTEAATDSTAAAEDSFVFVTDVEIVGEHLDEVFYKKEAPEDALQQRESDESEEEAWRRRRRESQRSGKESGSVLFGSEETTLTPIFISPGPPKIIDPILLEEPTAMSFMYSDLYEDAVGERRRSDEEYSEPESVSSEKTYKRRLSDSEEADGYLEKFILKDETPTVDVQTEPVEDKSEGRMMWSQSKFEMTGCLTRAVKEEDEDKAKTEDLTAREEKSEQKSATTEYKGKIATETDAKSDKLKLSMLDEEPTLRGAADESVQEPKLMEDQEGKDELKADQTEPPESISNELHPRAPQEDSTEKKKEVKTEVKEEHHSGVPPETAHIVETEQLPQTQEEEDKAAPVVVAALEETPVMETVDKESETLSEPPRESLCEEEAPDTSGVAAAVVAADEQTVTEATAEIEEPASEVQETHVPTETETSAEPTPQEEKVRAEVVPDVSEDAAPVEVITDCDAAVHAVVEVTENEADSKEIQTQVQIDLQEARGAEVVEREEEHQALAEETVVQSQVPEVLPEVDEAVKTEISSEAVKPVMPEEATIKTDNEQLGESRLHHEEESTPNTTPAVETVEANLQEKVNVGEEVILLVPKGQAVEMDIEVSEWLDLSPGEHQTSPETTTICPETPQAPDQEAMMEAQMEIKPEVALKKEALVDDELDNWISPPAPQAPDQEEMMEAQMEIKPEVALKEEALVDDELDNWISPPAPQAPDQEAMMEAQMETKPEVALKKEVLVDDKLDNWISPPAPQAPDQEAMMEAQMEIKPEVALKEKALVDDRLDNWIAPPAAVEEASISEREMDYDFEVDAGVFSPLRSFTAQEDLSDLQTEDVQLEAADVEQNAEIHKLEDASEAKMVTDDSGPEPEVFREDVVQKLVEATVEAPEVIVEELDYEVISRQDTKELPEPETQRDEEEPKPEPGQEREERVEMEEEEEKVLDVSPEEELIEADYDIIDSEEEQLARLAAELQGMDWFCLTCGFLLSEDDWTSGEHRSHDVTSVDKAYEEIKEKLSDWISELQGRSENIEDLVSELELAYNSVEDQCVQTEAAMQAQNEEMMALVMEQYNNMSVSMEEEKKAKLEQLYDQIVSFQESIDSAKATLDTTAREAETEARTPEDIHVRLKAALDSAMSLELGPRGLLVFEDYAKGNASSSHHAQRKGIPVPQRPTLQRQEPGSATSASVTVYWSVNPGDIIDCFQVYCMEDPQGAVSEEYRVTVKESYCVLEELEPDKTYKVWVMAVNYTGCSLPSERLAFRTAPSVPVIDTELCTVMWDSATLRWSSEKQTPEQSYTLEYCRQYELEGEGLRSISGIKSCEQKVLLQPSESYLFYIKAVNEAGASEQSEAALISTKGTRFHLLKASAHPALELSADDTTVHFSQELDENAAATQCPSILGELLPPRGRYYWETVVSRSMTYRLGVACSTADRNVPLGENSLSWCLQCIPTPSGCSYQLLHNGVQSTVFVIEMPERVGTLLDYQSGRLSFYNACSGQLLGSFCQRFTRPCHPALALERPGSLELSTVLDVPEFTADS